MIGDAQPLTGGVFARAIMEFERSTLRNQAII